MNRGTTEWLRFFSQLPGIPGHEAPVATEVVKAFGAVAGRVDRDPSGNVRGWILGSGDTNGLPGRRRPRAILTAHMDKIGFLVKAIEPGGFLRLTEVGGFDPRTLLGREVWVHAKPPIAALFATKAPHLQKKGESERVLGLDELYLDTGRPEREVRRRVPIGTPVTLRRAPVELLANRFAAPAMDNRSGLVVLLLTLEILSRSRPAWDVIAVATVEEEFGVYCLGARTASESLDPQLGIAIDVTHGDMPGTREGETYALGSGPSLCTGPNVHPRVLEGMRSSARAIGIPYSVEGIPMGSGTDAMDIQIAREGIPTGVIGVPCRYMHTGVETLDPRDVERTARLLAHYLASLPLDWSVVEVIK